MMGEIGIPYDLDKKKAYKDGDYSNQTRALDASLNACDGTNALNYSIWTYCPDNSHEYGDLWNGEDLSVWSADDAKKMGNFRASTSQVDLVGRISRNRSRANSKASSLYGDSVSGSLNGSGTRINIVNSLAGRVSATGALNGTRSRGASLATLTPTPSPYLLSPNLAFNLASSTTFASDVDEPLNLNDGARALCAFCRPYPMKTVGTPIDINFDIRTSLFTLSIRVDAGDVSDPDLPTEIYIPLVHYAAYPSRASNSVYLNSRSSASLLNSSTSSSTDISSSEKGLPSYLGSLSLDEDSGEDHQALALKVKVSAGRWETEGQTLRWYYPRPTSGSVVMKIEVERIKGAIPAWVNQIGVG